MEDPNCTIIIVDNGSTDDSVKQIRSAFPQHTLIENEKNLGFAEGNNVGLREGLKQGAELLILLNNDTVVAPNFLKELVHAAEKHPEVGAFGPKIYFYDEPATIWYAGGSVDPRTGRCYHIGCGAPSGHNQKKETDYICGCALAVRKSVLEKVGFLAPEFFLIWEEIDWCYRMRKAGYKCLFVPTAKVWHKVSASFIEGNRDPMWQYFYFRNRLLFHKRHSSIRKGLPPRELFNLIKMRFHPKTPPDERQRYRAALRGVWDFFLGRFGQGSLTKFIHK